MPRRPNAPEEVVQQVAVMAAAGHSTRQIESATGVSKATVSRWERQDDMRRLITEGRARIAARYVERVEAWLDKDDTVIEGTPLLIQYGISQDKFDKLEEPPPSPRTLVIVIPGIEQVPTIDTRPLG